MLTESPTPTSTTPPTTLHDEEPVIILMVGVVAFGDFACSANLREFWLPSEDLDFKNEEPFTGYVLKSNETHFVILREDPRVVVLRPKKDLTGREYCYLGDYWERHPSAEIPFHVFKYAQACIHRLGRR